MDLGARYLELVLGLRRLRPELVESYVGPAELASAVDAEPPPTAAALAEQAQELLALVEEAEFDPDRRGWLRSQLSAISTALEWLAGARFSYRELVARCHGVEVGLVPDEQFEEAHAKLDRVASGPGRSPGALRQLEPGAARPAGEAAAGAARPRR